MRLFSSSLILSKLGTAEKCSQPCDVGILSDSSVCNIEPCSYYDEHNILLNGRMENDGEGWEGISATITHQSDSYDNYGYLVTNRNANWKGIGQEREII